MASRSPPSHHHGYSPCLLRHHRRWCPRWQGHHGAPCGRRPKDLRELPCSLHRGEGFRIQGIQLPQGHPQLHVPGETSPLETAPEASLSMAASSRTRTSPSSTPDLESRPWLTPAPTPTAPNSSSALPRPSGCMASTSSSDRLLRAWTL